MLRVAGIDGDMDGVDGGVYLVGFMSIYDLVGRASDLDRRKLIQFGWEMIKVVKVSKRS